MRDYYAKNPEKHKALVKITRERHRERNLQIVREAREKPCADCGNSYPYYVMQFDHLGDEDKVGNVTQMARSLASEEKLLAEMAKCEVVCANCHCERTARRGGWSQT